MEVELPEPERPEPEIQEGELPLVSVVIPTYGRDEHLPEALESVTSQSYPKIELLIVDDGSPVPITETVGEQSFDELSSVTFIRHHTNRGANAARNTGIRAADGEYIAFLDDDDRWHEEKISRQVEAFLSAGPAVGVVYNGKKTEHPNGTTIMHASAEGDVMKDLLRGETFGQFSSIMVDSDVVDAVGLPDERFPAWQDREWFFRLAQHCQFKAVSDILTYKRVGLPDNITKNFEQKRDVAYPLFIEKHYSLAREYGIYYARTFLATQRWILARSAVRAGEYQEARKYFVLAFLANPLYTKLYPHLVASLGGERTYNSASYLRQKVQQVTALF